jgi:hypothetical protein
MITRKVINGKIYDTETAEHLGSDSYGCSGDFDSWAENLYVTKRGNYFLQGRGGARSCYAVSCGNNSVGGGSDIRPLTRVEALAWAEAHDQDAMEHFADMLEEA